MLIVQISRFIAMPVYVFGCKKMLLESLAEPASVFHSSFQW
jgi:hypothetical protein